MKTSLGVGSRLTHLSKSKQAAALLGASALVLSACGQSSDGSSVTLAYANFGGSMQEIQAKAYLDPFQDANPDVKVVMDGPPSVAKLKTMVDADRVTWSVVETGTIAYDPSSLLEKLDCDVVDCDGISEGISFDGYGMPFYIYADPITYRTDAFDGEIPQDWADYFDFEKFPGKRAISSSPTAGIWEQLLMADGVAPEDLYPLDLDRALGKLEEVKDHVVFWASSAECVQLLVSGEVNMANCSTGEIQPVASSEPIAVQWNQAIPFQANLIIPKGAPDKEEAMKLIAYMTGAEHGAALSEYGPYGLANKAASEQTSEKFQEWDPMQYPTQIIEFNVDNWYAKNGPEAAERLANFLAGSS